MTKFSQNNEQEYIDFFFGDRKGVFLDLGSNDGKTLSNTHALAKYKGWRGLCVEPAPIAFDKLQKLYSDREDVVCVKAAVSDYTGVAKFFDSGAHVSDSDTSLLSSLNKEETKRWGNTATFSEIEVNVITFEQLMKLSPYDKYELVSIDVEGEELKIIPQMDLKELGVEMLIVEFNGKQKEKFDELILPQGYELYYQNAENLLYTIKK